MALQSLPAGTWVAVNGQPLGDPFRYRVAWSSSPDGAEVGRGGLGRVVRAFDERIGREVALKELLPQPDGVVDPRLEEWFLREARIAGRLEHPNIIPIHDVGRGADGRPFFTMRLVRGATLAAVIDSAPTLIERLLLLRHVVDVAHALAHAHSRGVVHCDVKPDNVMVGEFGETVVLDWGLAHVIGLEDVPLAVAGAKWFRRPASTCRSIVGKAIGTPAYLSPEQAEGQVERFDERTDVWGLGALLYELLTGLPPHHAPTPAAALRQVRRRDPVPVRHLEPLAPGPLAAIAERALRREPARRVPTARQFAAEVEAFLPVDARGPRRRGAGDRSSGT